MPIDMQKILDTLENDTSAYANFTRTLIGNAPPEEEEELSIRDLLHQVLKGQLILMQEIEELKDKLGDRDG